MRKDLERLWDKLREEYRWPGVDPLQNLYRISIPNLLGDGRRLLRSAQRYCRLPEEATALFLRAWLPCLDGRKIETWDTYQYVAAVDSCAMMLDDEEIAADKEMFRVISWAMQLAHYRDDLGRARKWLDQGGFDVLPPEVRNYLIDLLFNFEHAIRERPRQLTCGGQARPERDRVIVFAIDTVREVFRLHEKRSVASKDKDKKESACSIVFKALGLLNVGHGLTEAAVNTIWDKHKRRSKKLRE